MVSDEDGDHVETYRTQGEAIAAGVSRRIARRARLGLLRRLESAPWARTRPVHRGWLMQASDANKGSALAFRQDLLDLWPVIGEVGAMDVKELMDAQSGPVSGGLRR